MAKQVLPTNFMDDILNESMNGKRRWIITQNDDGTYTFEDATTYDQLGNTFGQAQVNEMNKAINESVDQARVIDDYKTLAAVNQNGFVPGAKPVAQLISDLNAINDNGAIKGMDAREDGVYITYVPSSGADSVTKKLGSEPQLLGTLTGNGTFDCKKIANYKQLTKDNFFIIPKTVRARFNAPRGTDSSNMGWNSTKELKSIEYNADTGILSFYLTTSDSYSYGSYWAKSYSIDITGDLYCVF